MKKSLTIEDLKERTGKPIFVVALKNDYKKKNGWYVLAKINEFKSEDENTGYIEFTDSNCINFKNAENFRLFDTEVSEEELAEILKEEEKSKKKTGYERVPKEQYSSVSIRLESINYRDDAFNFDNETYSIANYFNDETLGENIARAERLRYQLRRYAALNGGILPIENWCCGDDWKFSVVYDYNNQEIHIRRDIKYKDFGQIYFKSEEACKKAIETFKDELLWYFTEFKEMLY